MTILKTIGEVERNLGGSVSVIILEQLILFLERSSGCSSTHDMTLFRLGSNTEIWTTSVSFSLLYIRANKKVTMTNMELSKRYMSRNKKLNMIVAYFQSLLNCLSV